MSDQTVRSIADLIYVGFNSQVIALDRYTGEVAWTWKSPKGKGFVALLIESDRVIVSVQGYMHCLDPVFGQEVWSNPLEGMGTGTPCLASSNASGGTTLASSAAAELVRQAQAAAAATVVT